jgi:hypothetical protein
VKGEAPAEIHHQIVSVYGDVMNRQNVVKWCREFNAGRTDVHDEQRTGRSSLINIDLVQKVEDICADRCVTINELHGMILEVSKSLVHEIVKKKFDYCKLCAWWVPKILIENHKKNQMGAALTFLTHYSEKGDEFLDSIVTGDESWVFHRTPESRQQSMEWRHTHSRTKRKFKMSTSTKKIMATVFWDQKGVLLGDFVPHRTTINTAAYCEILKRPRCAIQNRR